MKKALSIIGKGLIIVFATWFLISWYDIMADNTEPNPQHLKWNMFIVMFPEAEETRKADCEVVTINYNDDVVTFVDEEGETWIAEVDEAIKYSVKGLHTLTYKVNNPTDKYDDEIIDIN